MFYAISKITAAYTPDQTLLYKGSTSIMDVILHSVHTTSYITGIHETDEKCQTTSRLSYVFN